MRPLAPCTFVQLGGPHDQLWKSRQAIARLREVSHQSDIDHRPRVRGDPLLFLVARMVRNPVTLLFANMVKSVVLALVAACSTASWSVGVPGAASGWMFPNFLPRWPLNNTHLCGQAPDRRVSAKSPLVVNADHGQLHTKRARYTIEAPSFERQQAVLEQLLEARGPPCSA